MVFARLRLSPFVTRIVMFVFFCLVATGLAGYAGYTGMPWYMIFLSAFLFALAAATHPERRHFHINELRTNTVAYLTKLPLLLTLAFSLVTAPIYLIAGLFS